jgi:hypothetical protein
VQCAPEADGERHIDRIGAAIEGIERTALPGAAPTLIIYAPLIDYYNPS